MHFQFWQNRFGFISVSVFEQLSLGGRMGHDRCQGLTKREHCAAQQSTSNVAQHLMSLNLYLHLMSLNSKQSTSTQPSMCYLRLAGYLTDHVVNLQDGHWGYHQEKGELLLVWWFIPNILQNVCGLETKDLELNFFLSRVMLFEKNWVTNI